MYIEHTSLCHLILIELSVMVFINNQDITSLSYTELFINRLMWIHIIVIALAGTSLILTWKYVYKISKLYWRVKSKFKNNVRIV